MCTQKPHVLHGELNDAPVLHRKLDDAPGHGIGSWSASLRTWCKAPAAVLETIRFAFDPEPAEEHGAVDRCCAPARRTDQRAQRQGRHVRSPLPAPGKRIADEAQERAPQCPVWDLGRVGLEAGAHVVRQLLERGCGDLVQSARQPRSSAHVAPWNVIASKASRTWCSSRPAACA